MRMGWMKKGLAAAFGGLAVLLLAAVGVLSAMYSPTYLYRTIAWQAADVGDHARFPERPVAAAATPFVFEPSDDPDAEARVMRALGGGLAGMSPEAFLAETGTQAFIVVQHDRLLAEGYFGGFGRDSIATSFSVAKSYLSALIGIAIEEGAIGGLDDSITTYLPELLERDARFADITIRDLLDMTSGIGYEETGFIGGDDSLTYYFEDLRELALHRTRIDEPPGERWHYNNYNPLLLGIILERATGMPVAEYLEQRLWTRIGAEFPASWSLDREGGLEKLESGINARPIDFAKLGRLYLHGGDWDGHQVVPAEWVADSMTGMRTEPGFWPPEFSSPDGSLSHALYWWRMTRPNGEVISIAHGNLGQFVVVAPAQDLVIVRTGAEYGASASDWFLLFGVIADGLSEAG
jgi:CubicO group peptidase (beta-lactamase class C family)